MCHICVICGSLCYCDFEDHQSEEAPDDCFHECDELETDDDFDLEEA